MEEKKIQELLHELDRLQDLFWSVSSKLVQELHRAQTTHMFKRPLLLAIRPKTSLAVIKNSDE